MRESERGLGMEEIAGHGTRKELHGEGGKQEGGQHAATAVSASQQPGQQAGEHQS